MVDSAHSLPSGCMSPAAAHSPVVVAGHMNLAFGCSPTAGHRSFAAVPVGYIQIAGHTPFVPPDYSPTVGHRSLAVE